MDIVFLSEFTVNPGQFRTLIHSHLSILIDSPPPDSLYRLIHINKVIPRLAEGYLLKNHISTMTDMC